MSARVRLGHGVFALMLDTYVDYIPEQDCGALNMLPEAHARHVINAKTATNVFAPFGRQSM